MALQTDKPTKTSEFIDNAKAIGFALGLFLVVRILIFQPFTIPSSSMEPGLRPGDYIFVTKWDYGFSRYSIPFSPDIIKGRILERTPHRGDVIVFRVPTDRNRDYIKRIIGLPGDRIQVREGLLYINDAPVKRVEQGVSANTDPYSLQPTARRETLPGGRTFTTYDQGYFQQADDTGVFLVPEGHYFFMGDNRDNSLDSRFETARGGVGLVPSDRLIGRARFIMLSWDGASIFKPWTWFTKAKPGRFFKAVP